MTGTPRHSVSVAAVITNDKNEILVIQRRDNGAWQIPGGVLELDESLQDGVRREVMEETGVQIELTQLTGIYKHMKLGVVALVFRARFAGGTPQPTEESVNVSWWSTERVAAEMEETFATRVFDALENPLAPTIRHHDGSNFVDA